MAMPHVYNLQLLSKKYLEILISMNYAYVIKSILLLSEQRVLYYFIIYMEKNFSSFIYENPGIIFSIRI